MYELFVYTSEQKWLNGNYHKIIHKESIPIVGSSAGCGFVVSGVYESFGIIDIVCEKK